MYEGENGFTPDPRSDSELVAASRTDPEVFGILYERYFPRVFRYVYRRVGPADAEDLTADVFLNALKGLGKFQDRGEGFFTGWLFKIAHNTAANRIRNKKNRPEVNLDDTPNMTDRGSLTPQEISEQDEQSRRIRAIIMELSQEQQNLLMLIYVVGLSNQEIAQALSKSTGAIKSQKFRLLQSLKEKLTEEKEAKY